CTVLNGVDLEIPRGKIYCLLGPSGCGKTTLLKAIMGRQEFSYGTVQVLGTHSRFGISPGTIIGYMPQETSLFKELTIYENLYYFGKIGCMQKCVLTKFIQQLVEELELPASDCLVGQLSIGQQRRVSLAVALICKPPILIL